MAYTPQLIVVSNRLPFVLTENDEGKLERQASAGGLVTAVAPVVVETGGMWVGWPGSLYKKGMAIPEADPNDNTPTAGLKSNRVIPVELERNLFINYYNGCCNDTFWPLFHSMPDRANYSADHWKDYITANQLFAEKAIEALVGLQKTKDVKGKPLVWIHDYHLMLAAYTIRKAAIRSTMKFKLGFFLHIPFPPWDIFRIFPWGDHVLQGMLGNDMIGFHTYDYCLNFVDCCNRRLRCRVDRKALLVEHGGRSVRVRPLPIGIPYDRFTQLATEAEPILSDKKVILGVDRLDYTKGLPQRLKAFEVLLTRYPEHIEKVVLLQVAVPSRTDIKEYQDLKEEMDQLVGHINGRFATATWSPIRYIYGTLTQHQLASFYRDSAVAFITPLRDGMNLVAKEYVACQVKDPPGVLIISPFAGAGESMNEALICNPYEFTEAAEVLHRALTMPEDERTLRMNYLRRREKARDVQYWLKSFLKAMGTLISEDGDIVLPYKLRPMTLDEFDEYFSAEVFDNKKLALLLDYDGTLAPIASHPDLAVLPSETKAVLQRLVNNSNIHVSIISGRSVQNVKEMVGIDNITYAGSHGLEIIHPDGTRFTYPMPKEYEDTAEKILKALQEQVCRDGAWVENKGVYLTFHYRETPVDLRPDLVSKAMSIIEDFGFISSHAHAAVEAKPPIGWNKGRASIYILRTAFGLDWSNRVTIIYAGDDNTDEDAMQALKGMAITFRVTSSDIIKTAADRRLPSTESVVTLLKWIERYFTLIKKNNPTSISS